MDAKRTNYSQSQTDATSSVNKSNPQQKYCFFGDRMIYVMQLRNITCKELAKRIFTAPSTITGYRIGRRSPNIAELASIARELNVSLDYLAGLKSEPEKIYPDE